MYAVSTNLNPIATSVDRFVETKGQAAAKGREFGPDPVRRLDRGEARPARRRTYVPRENRDLGAVGERVSPDRSAAAGSERGSSLDVSAILFHAQRSSQETVAAESSPTTRQAAEVAYRATIDRGTHYFGAEAPLDVSI